MDTINVGAAIVTVAAFAFALWQHAHRRHVEDLERMKVATQRERLRGSANCAVAAASAANLIVQRAKEPGTTVLELQNIARVLRSDLLLLARHLQSEEHVLQQWRFGQAVVLTPHGGSAVEGDIDTSSNITE